MLLPALDVDFHWDWLIPPGSRAGQAQSCVEIGAPFFEKPRLFWARLARLLPGDYGHVLLRPVEAEASRIFVALYAFHDQQNLEDFWQHGLCSTQYGDAPFSHLERCWRPDSSDIWVQFRLGATPILHWSKDSACSYSEPKKWTLDEFIEWSTSEFHEFLRHQWEDPRSQMRLTYEWYQLSRRDQYDASFDCGRGRWSYAVQLLSWVLKSEGLANRNIAQLGASWSYLSPKQECFFRTSTSRLQRFTSSERMQAWLSAILRHFQPVKTGEQVPQLIGENRLNAASVGCGPLSEHEILEARLRLNTWARQNLALDEATRLIEMESNS